MSQLRRVRVAASPALIIKAVEYEPMADGSGLRLLAIELDREIEINGKVQRVPSLIRPAVPADSVGAVEPT